MRRIVCDYNQRAVLAGPVAMIGRKAVLATLLLFTASSQMSTRCGPCDCTQQKGCFKADCSSRGLNSVPLNIPNNVCSLDMSFNNIPRLINNKLRRFSNLLNLSLSSNEIADIQSLAFRGLRKLVNLDLKNNSLGFFFSDTNSSELIFEPMKSLKVLDVSGNELEDYPHAALSRAISLRQLTLDGIYNKSFGQGFAKLRKLKHLSLSGSVGDCNLESLWKLTFDNVRHVQTLNVSNCHINFVEPGVLAKFHNLSTLDISSNIQLGFQGLENILSELKKCTLRVLIINKILNQKMLCVVVKESTINYLQNMSIQTIKASSNGIQAITEDAIERLPKTLKALKLKNNRLYWAYHVKSLRRLESLETLELDGIPGIFRAPLGHTSNLDTACPDRNCREEIHGRSLSNSIARKQLNILSAPPSAKYTFDVPPKLRRISNTYNQICCMVGNLTLSKNVLEYVDFSFNLLTAWFGYVRGVESVKCLNLSTNLGTSVSKTFFRHFTSLQILNISNNYLRESFFSDTEGEIFKHQVNLIHLDLSRNGLLNLSEHFLQGMRSLVVLDLLWNELYSIDFNVEHSPNLKFLNCTANQIQWLSHRVRKGIDKLTEKHPFNLDLSYNPLLCICDHLDFFEWLIFSNVTLSRVHKHKCIRGDGSIKIFKDKDDLYNTVMELRGQCNVHYALTISLMGVLISTLTAVVSAIVYRFRWWLIYLYCSIKRRFKSRQSEYEPFYDFDAFISYPDEFRSFVLDKLRHRLEDRGLRLYLRDRDSLPGADIAENIIDGIQRSKKSVMLLSTASLDSKWCTYELNIANMEGVCTRRNVMIVLMLENIPLGHIPPKVLYLVHKSAYMQYPDSEDTVDYNLFWNNLDAAIRA